MAKQSPHKVLNVRIDPAVHKALKIIAEVDKRSMTNMAEVIIEQYAKKWAEEHQEYTDELQDLISPKDAPVTSPLTDTGTSTFATGAITALPVAS